MDEETTAGGSRIFRHEQRERELAFSGGDAELIEAVERHVAEHFPGYGDDATVWHEVISDLVHVDVHVVPPSDERPFYTLVTSGMGERPMTVPEGLEDYRHAELVLGLPPDWPVAKTSFEDEKSYWPIRLLKMLARLPHEFDTFLYHGHTVPNGDPPEPYAASTRLCCALIARPITVPDGFEKLELADGRAVHFFGVVALTADEMDFKLKKGSDGLFSLLDHHGVSELLDPDRVSVVPRKRGFFRR